MNIRGRSEADMAHCTGSLICPVCTGALEETATSLKCTRGHNFDRAREGYVHLLPAGHGRTGKRGDTRNMVLARQRFLARGYYQPLAEAIEKLAVEHLSAPGRPDARVVVEIGCAAGDMIGKLARNAAQNSMPACFFGIDLSKEALKLAARAHPRVRFLINDVKHRLCFADGSVDLLLDSFAPRNPAEFARVLRPDGLLLVVVPGAHHLAELRRRVRLLAVQPDKLAQTLDFLGPAFQVLSRHQVEHRTTVAAADLPDLLRMTPNAWHLDEAAFEQVAQGGPLEVTAAFTVLRLCRSAEAGVPDPV